MSDLLNLQFGSQSTTQRWNAPSAPRFTLKTRIVALLASLLLCFPGFSPANAEPDNELDPASTEILNRYLQASQNQDGLAQGASMEIDINASVPKLKEHGRLRALRNISKVGKITYRVLGFQGSNTVKNQVIARYLQAEQQSQGDQKLAITPTNYKFKYKGEWITEGHEDVYVFQIAPHKKRVGLFKGEMWVDAHTCLPVYEKGRLVKNPSIFFKNVDFERAFAIKDGQAIPEYMSSTINTRIIGKVELNVSYSNFTQDKASDDIDGAIEPAESPSSDIR